MLGLLAGMIPVVIKGLANMIKGIAEFIRNPKDLRDATDKGIGSAIMDGLKNVFKAIVESAPILLAAVSRSFQGSLVKSIRERSSPLALLWVLLSSVR